ncbi:unnamed protein product, partial [Dicrocoelium dendriticum]
SSADLELCFCTLPHDFVMPISRRTTIRSAVFSTTPLRTPEQYLSCAPHASTLPPMEHVIFPVLSRWSSSSFYSYIISLSVLALMLQYLSIYKTVWWSANSEIDYPLDFRLIDFFLFGHCVNMLVAPRSYLLFIQ